MKKTICDGCGREFKGMDEYVSQQGVHIKLEMVSGRRDHQTPKYYDFDDFDCVLKWLREVKAKFPGLIWKST